MTQCNATGDPNRNTNCTGPHCRDGRRYRNQRTGGPGVVRDGDRRSPRAVDRLFAPVSRSSRSIEMVESGKPSGFVGSLEKGLRVIRAFDADSPQMTLSEVAAKTGLDRAGARRFLLTLVDLGYAQCQGKLFSLTPKILDLGFSYLSSAGLPELVTPFLERISRELNESSSVSVLDGLDVVYVARVSTKRIMSVALGIGARLPAVATSMGRVLLAHLAPEAQEDVMSRAELARPTPRAVTTKARLRKILIETKKQGFCLVDQELEEGLRSIAVPLLDHDGRIHGAMNVSCQANRVGLDEMRKRHLKVLNSAADEMKALLPSVYGG